MVSQIMSLELFRKTKVGQLYADTVAGQSATRSYLELVRTVRLVADEEVLRFDISMHVTV